MQGDPVFRSEVALSHWFGFGRYLLGLDGSSVRGPIEPVACARCAADEVLCAMHARPLQGACDEVFLCSLGEYVAKRPELAFAPDQRGRLVALPHSIWPIDVRAPATANLSCYEADEPRQIGWGPLKHQVRVVGQPRVSVEPNVGPELLGAADDPSYDVVEDAAPVGTKKKPSLKASKQDVVDDRRVVESSMPGSTKRRGRFSSDWQRACVLFHRA